MSAEATFLMTFAMIIGMKIVCFILGYLIIKLGHNLISSGVKGEFKFSAKFAGVKADLANVSPGLLFVLLGVFLIAFAIFVEKDATLEKTPKNVIEKPAFSIPKKSLNLQNNKLIKKEEESDGKK